MKAIRDMWLIQIEVTNVCHLQCANCTRFIGHNNKTYFMDLRMIEKAIDSLEGYPGGIGIMGGEPLLHPKFSEICELVQKKIPKGKRGLWTSGYKWDEYEPIIRETFGERVVYNDHTGHGQTHQPLLIAIDDVVEDKKFMKELIDNCWVQRKWSASINPKGGFFCEVAAAMDMLFEGPGGYPIEKGWWDKTPEQFQDQVARYCYKCGGALPLPPISNKEEKDLVSPSNYKKLEELKTSRFLRNRVVLYDKKATRQDIERNLKNWKPWYYLGENGRRSSRKLYGVIGLRDIKTGTGKIQKKAIKKYTEFKDYISKVLNKER